MRTRALRWLRLSALILGGILVLWVAIEDHSELTVLFFSLLICGLAAAYLLTRGSTDDEGDNADDKGKSITKRLILFPMVGVVAGLAITLVAIFLMAFKSGVHGHGTPDYSPEQVITIVSSTPIWVLVGVFLGSAWMIWKR